MKANDLCYVYQYKSPEIAAIYTLYDIGHIKQADRPIAGNLLFHGPYKTQPKKRPQ